MASVTAPPAAATTAPAPKRNLARIAELTWIWSIVGYSVLRFVIAWGAFAEHGANIWVFGILDVGTAWPYAKSVAEVCKRAAHAEFKRLPIPLSVAVTTFFLPYVYLWFAAGEMPAGVRVGMIICVSVLLLAATAGVLAKTRKLRRDARLDTDAGAVVLASVGAVDGQVIDLRESPGVDELIIDLTGDDVRLERPSATSR